MATAQGTPTVSFNSLWPSNAIWQHTSGSTLAKVMACCLTAPSLYLNQCWLLVIEVLCYSPDSNYPVSAGATIHYNEFENYTCRIPTTYPWGQWVKSLGLLDLDLYSNCTQKPCHHTSTSLEERDNCEQLVQKMACCLAPDSTKPFPEPMWIYNQLKSDWRILVRQESKIKIKWFPNVLEKHARCNFTPGYWPDRFNVAVRLRQQAWTNDD